MIYAFNFSCLRDMDLSELMQRTLLKYCKNIKAVISIDTDKKGEYQGYGCGCGWPQGLLKVKYLRYLFERYEIKDTDFILSVDSDVVFTSPEVFTYINPAYGIIGVKHQQPYMSEYGPFGHLSGALIFIRGDIARKIAEMNDQELEHIRISHFKKHNITENEDVMLSYFAKYVGAEVFDIGSVRNLTSGDFENDILQDTIVNSHYPDSEHVLLCGGTDPGLKTRFFLKSFYHLNYCPTKFLGEVVSGKWDIPKVLKQKGIEL